MAEIPPVVERALLKERDDLVRQRQEACVAFDVQIAEIDSYLGRTAAAKEGGLQALTSDSIQLGGVLDIKAAKEANRLAVQACIDMLKERSPLKTPVLHKGLVARGLLLKAGDPERRLGQLLSSDDTFKSDRKNGWSLKSEASNSGQAVEASGATMSDPDEL